MATTRRKSRSGAAAREASAAERLAAERTALLESVDVALGHVPTMDAAATVDAAFKDDEKVRANFKKNYRARSSEAKTIAKETNKVFKNFEPSLFSSRDREPRTYLAPGENLTTALDGIVKRGIKERKDDNDRRSLKLRLSDDVKSLVTETPGDTNAGTLVLTDLISLLTLKLQGTPALRDEPAFTACAAEREAVRQLDEIEGKPPAKTPAPVADEESPNGDHEPSRTRDFVAKHVHDLMAHMPSPEEQPILAPSERDDLDFVHKSIDNLELRSGPSDVTSYHDFNSLQVAFEHVWAEVFDTRIEEVGRELYDTYIELVDFTGYDANSITSVTSLEDIGILMTHATELGRVTENATPPNTISKDLTDAYNQVRSNAIWQLYSYIQDMPLATDIANTLFGPLLTQIERFNATASSNTQISTALRSVHRLEALLTKLDSILKQKYAFTVFTPYSSNFGIMVTYRQTWRPEQYQVGDLVSTIPLAPRETRRYTTKQITKKSRTTKEIENNLRANKTDVDSTARADREIVNRAENRTNFKVTADGSFGTDANKIHATAEGGGDTAKISEDTKKNFHEAVLKSAQEYKHDNRMEIETTSGEETETTTFHEIQNPNDELTVTYLFYELQRTYRISEKIHHVTPVVLIANEVPAPNEIDDAWLMKHDWILRRVLLDDSFRPALDYLTKSFVGDELNLQILDSNAQTQRQVVDAIKGQVATQLGLVAAAEHDLSTTIATKGGLEFAEGILSTVKRVFDPLKVTGDTVTGTKEGMDTVAEYAQETLDRAEREKAHLLDQLAAANSALQAAIDKLSAAIKEHYDRVTEIDRLRIHVKENILYYMQAIWNHEPPDQRFFRVFSKEVPVIEPKNTNVTVSLKGGTRIEDTLTSLKTFETAMPFPDFDIKWKPLVEIADLDEVLGYKGNYAIYRLKQNNYLTLHMMQDYLEVSDEVKVRDPDDIANYTVEDLQELATCLYTQHKSTYTDHRKEIKQMIIDRLTSGRAEDDRVIVPTKALYIEALVGTHPLLEDFKLLHRALDVKKVQSETRRAELENVRLAARALKGNVEDPDIEKKIVVENGSGVIVPTD
jgi:hypothetical protein